MSVARRMHDAPGNYERVSVICKRLVIIIISLLWLDRNCQELRSTCAASMAGRSPLPGTKSELHYAEFREGKRKRSLIECKNPRVAPRGVDSSFRLSQLNDSGI
jgi:hypothetical protein